ncbi:hypothetical protein [Sulfurimonas sp.]
MEIQSQAPTPPQSGNVENKQPPPEKPSEEVVEKNVESAQNSEKKEISEGHIDLYA